MAVITASKNTQTDQTAAALASVYRGVPADVRADELPFEEVNEFSDAPFEFELTAGLLWKDTQKVYYHACRANRFSDDYLKYCGQLEKSIRQIGSFCITKAVLEKNGSFFASLNSMNIEELVRMVSYHLRKCHAALDGIYQDNNFLGITYLNWEFRWVKLESRLRATENKIQKIRSGELKTESMLSQTQHFKGAQRSNTAGSEEAARSLRINANALPLNGSLAGEMLRMEKVREKETPDRWYDEDYPVGSGSGLGLRWENSPLLSQKETVYEMTEPETEQTSGSEEKPEQPSEAQEPNDPAARSSMKNDKKDKNPDSDYYTEAEARKILIDRAKKQGNEAAVLAIEREDVSAFRQRWDRYLDEMENMHSIRGGPSAATRKKLREKRKKRK